MASKTDIANQALGRVGAKLIFDLGELDNKNARIVSNVFEATVRELARMHKWNCLKRRSSLAQVLPAPAFGWTYAYELPADCLRMVSLNGHDAWQDVDEFEIEGRRLLTDEPTAEITYIAYEEDANQYDSLFTDCLVVLLASKIAVTVRQDEAVAAQLKEEFIKHSLPQAKRIDGNERKAHPINLVSGSAWVRSRHISTNG